MTFMSDLFEETGLTDVYNAGKDVVNGLHDDARDLVSGVGKTANNVVDKTGNFLDPSKWILPLGLGIVGLLVVNQIINKSSNSNRNN